jgi:uroporphyrinogen decarboxylase
MKHRDRVLMALNHEPPDRCPMQISFTPEFASRLRSELGQIRTSINNPQSRGNTFELECALDEDLLLSPVGWVNSHYIKDPCGDGASTYTDDWGVKWRDIEYQTRFGPGVYTEMAAHPLAEDAAIETYKPPDPNRPELYEEAEMLVRDYRNERWIVGMTVCTIFETAWALRGYERLLTDFVHNPELAGRILDIPFRYHLIAAQKLVDLGVDMIWTGDDVGTQNRMLMSPVTWRKFLKPRLAEFITGLKRRKPRLKIAYHTDGCVYPIIPDLIEIGIDVLNPIQPQSMDPKRLKTEYGKKLSFWGTIDIQQTLPFGTPDDVRAEVRERLRTVGRDGGLILGPTHNVQLDTPLENFWAMVRAITGTPYDRVQAQSA